MQGRELMGGSISMNLKSSLTNIFILKCSGLKLFSCAFEMFTNLFSSPAKGKETASVNI
jgi:hypothetical protein